MFKNKVVIFVFTLLLSAALAACGTKAATDSGEGGEEIARPSNPGGAGTAVGLTGNAVAGKDIYTANCESCHGPEGKGGVENPGGVESVPSLNPIDSTLISTDMKTYVTNLDLFMEHGSTPEGTNPTLTMKAFGDTGTLTPQQIADVIAYIISLNK